MYKVLRIFLFSIFLCAASSGKNPLIDVQTVEDLPVFVNLRYATQNNFTGKKIYDFTHCYLRKEAVQGLQKAVALAAQEKEPFTFCLWDCYRPPTAQEKLWEAFPNPSYVASPKKGSRHSRGMAIDLTPCDFNGKPLEMPTDFDNFTTRANMDYYDLDLSDPILQRRETLKEIMKKAGFSFTRTEWWHFDKKGWRNKPILNILPEN